MEQKRRAVVSYDNMNDELLQAFNEKYPKGLADYLPDVRKIDKPDGTSIYTVEVETDEAIFLVKVQMKVDDAEDLNKWLDEEAGDDISEDDNGGEGETLPDENIAQYSNGEDDSSEGD